MMPENSAADYWPALDRSGKLDHEVNDLHDAIFLFAVRVLQGAKKDELPEIWKRYAPHWRRRLIREAFVYVQTVCSVRYASFQAQTRDDGPTQIGMAH